MTSKDSFGDRMKMYEGAEAQRKFLPGLPIVARLDGRGFSRFTKGLNRPYDQRMIDAMVRMVEVTNAHPTTRAYQPLNLMFSGLFGKRLV